jgi:hypothetical protein
VYECKCDQVVLYVLPVETILGQMPEVSIGDIDTVPFSMRKHAEDFVGAAFDTRAGSGDGHPNASRSKQAIRVPKILQFYLKISKYC